MTTCPNNPKSTPGQAERMGAELSSHPKAGLLTAGLHTAAYSVIQSRREASSDSARTEKHDAYARDRGVLATQICEANSQEDELCKRRQQPAHHAD